MTNEQIEQARTNTKQLKDCPEWMQKLFKDAPDKHTLDEDNDGFYNGTSEVIIYHISDEYAEELKAKCSMEHLKENWKPFMLLTPEEQDFLRENWEHAKALRYEGTFNEKIHDDFHDGITYRLAEDFEFKNRIKCVSECGKYTVYVEGE